MKYAIIGHSRLHNSHFNLAKEDVLLWNFKKSCIAQFFSSLNSNDKTSFSYGENSDFLWYIQGGIFNSSDNSPANELDIVKTLNKSAEDFTSLFWGSYLIIAFNKKEDNFSILADPCGQHPVFYFIADDGSIHIGDFVEDFLTLGNVRLDIDDEYLHDYLTCGYGDISSTGWSQLKLLPPGKVMIKSDKYPIRFDNSWSPIFHQSRKTSPQNLLAKVLECQFKESTSIILELSGGVDSTSIAVALKESNLDRKITAITYFDPARKASDEVEIAKAVAKFCNLEHKTYPLLKKLPFTPIENRPPLVVRPGVQLCFLARLKDQADTDCLYQDCTMLNGHGGDAMFLSPPPFGTPIDLFSDFKIFKSIRTIFDLAIFYRLPIIDILKNIAAQSISNFSDYLTQDISEAIIPVKEKNKKSILYGEYLKDISLILKPARRLQICSLATTLEETLIQINPTGTRPNFPFLCQPMVELALSLKPGEFFSGYQDRLPLRNCTYGISKLENIWRRDKGDTTHSILKGINNNIDYIREVCLEGYCSSKNWIDRPKLESIIKRAALGYPSGLVKITRVFSIEMFLKGRDDNS